MCGRRLIRRLYQNESELMSYEDIATTVFTPLEYGAIGLSEEKAYEKYLITYIY
jgi:thioredoxin reductase (NADPH)